MGARVTVRQSVAEVRGKIHIGETKTGERRSVPIAASLLEPLAAQVAGRGRDEFVWPDRNGGPLRGSTLRSRHYKPAAARAGLEGLRFHDYADLRVMPTSVCEPLRRNVIGLFTSA